MSQSPPFPVTSEAIDRDGFVVWADLVPPDVVAAHLSGYEAWLDQRGRLTTEAWAGLTRARQVEIFKADYQWHEHDPAALDLFYRPELVAFLTEHFGAEPIMRAPQTGERQRGASLHADGFTNPVLPAGSEIRVWIALEDVDPAAGPLYLVPGSHHFAEDVRRIVVREHPDLVEAFLDATARHSSGDETPEAFRSFGRVVEEGWITEMTERRTPRVVPTLRQGDAIIFRTDVAHGTMPCVDPTLTRRHALAFFSSAEAAWHRFAAVLVPPPGGLSEETRMPWTIGRNARGGYITDWLDAPTVGRPASRHG